MRRAPQSSSSADEVLVVVELLADEPLRLALVRRDESGSASMPSRSGSPSGRARSARPAVEVADRLGVEGVVDSAGKRAGEDDESAPRER